LTAASRGARIEHVFLQTSLFGSDEPAVDREFTSAARSALSGASWVEFVPGWLRGSDTLFSELLEHLDLRQRTGIAMYDSIVDEPRLSAWWHADDGEPEPHPVLAELRWALVDRYHRPFDAIGFNLYRDGDDSVAWHADRHHRYTTDPAIAIVSVGAARPLRMRRNDGGPSLSWSLGGGDLFVMGGACQHEWQHCVPKLRRAVGPRLSITFRHDVRAPTG
jgi:hypothetical protein